MSAARHWYSHCAGCCVCFCRGGVERIPTAAQSLALVNSKNIVSPDVMTGVRFAMAPSMVAGGDFDKCGLGGRLLT